MPQDVNHGQIPQRHKPPTKCHIYDLPAQLPDGILRLEYEESGRQLSAALLVSTHFIQSSGYTPPGGPLHHGHPPLPVLRNTTDPLVSTGDASPSPVHARHRPVNSIVPALLPALQRSFIPTAAPCMEVSSHPLSCPGFSPGGLSGSAVGCGSPPSGQHPHRFRPALPPPRPSLHTVLLPTGSINSLRRSLQKNFGSGNPEPKP